MAVVIKKSNSQSKPELKLVPTANPLFKAVADYLDRGWHVLPMTRNKGEGKTACYMGKQQQHDFSCTKQEISKKFASYSSKIGQACQVDGVGLHLEKSTIAGIDVDCPEAVPFLEAFLPQTAIVGRDGKQVSWMLYKLNPAPMTDSLKNKSFHDCDETGKPGKELGGLKFKAVVPLPPTTHAKSTEVLRWTHHCDLTKMDVNVLIESVARVNALTIIALRWPGETNRHNATLALAGALAKAGWSLEEATKAFKALVTVTNDKNGKDRLNALKSTFESYEAEMPVTGLPTLLDHLTSVDAERHYLNKALSAWLLCNLHPEEVMPQESFGHYVYSLPEFMALPIPPQEHIVQNWFPEESLINVYGKAGVGKTWWAMKLARSIAEREDFFDWIVSKARRVLYIDGEMSPKLLMKRLSQVFPTQKHPENFDLVPVMLMLKANRSLFINEKGSQLWIEDYLEKAANNGKKHEVIFLDNLSQLTTGIDPLNNAHLDTWLPWLNKLRSKGYSIVLVSHAGKNGEELGSSAKHNPMASVVKLQAVGNSHEGAHFKMSFDKHRDEMMPPYTETIKLSRHYDGSLIWGNDGGSEMNELSPVEQMLFHIWNCEPGSVNEIIASGKCGKKSAVYNRLNSADKNGLLDLKNITLTEQGLALIKPLIEEHEELSGKL